MSRPDEEALRALVRDAVRRHLGPSAPSPGEPQRLPFAAHASHARYTTLPESDGPCLIEPSVPCTHCGYCQAQGH